MSSDSDSEEFYDAADYEEAAKEERKKPSVSDEIPPQKSASPIPKKPPREFKYRTSQDEPDPLSAYELELQELETQRLLAEQKRKQEDEELQRRMEELQRKKKEEEKREQERLLQEELKKEKERAEIERRLREQEERRKEQQEAEERRLEAEMRRKRLEQMREGSQKDSLDEEHSDHSTQSKILEDQSKTPISDVPKKISENTSESPKDMPSKKLSQKPSPNMEPDVIAMTKPNQPAEGPPSPMAPPVAPPRRKKKSKKLQQRLQIPDSLSLDSMSVTSSISGYSIDSRSIDEEQPKGSTGLPPENLSTGVLTPTTTIESLTKELEHSLDIASATCGAGIILHRDTQSIKGGEHVRALPIQKKTEGSSEKDQDADKRARTPETEQLLQYHLLMKGQSVQGETLTDEEILSLVMVKNLDTGEQVSLLKAEDKLPQCVNPLSLHIMRLTSEYVSNSSLDKTAQTDEEKEEVTVSQQVKHKKKKLKKFLSKTAHKIKSKADETFKHDEQDFSEEESLPDTRAVKFKAASSNKGPYEFDQLKLAQDLSGVHTGAIWTMKFSYCGRLLATGGQDHLLRVWVLKDHYTYFDDMRQKYSTESTSQHQQQGDGASSDEDRRSAQDENFVGEASKGEKLAAEDVEDSHEANSDIASSSDDDISVFSPSPFCTYTGHTADLLDISWSKNYFLLSSSMDKMVRLWHISRRECLCCFQHIDFVTAIAFHPRDDRYFLSGSLDGKLRLWNIPDKKVALWNEVDGPSKLVTTANFIQNGRFAVAGTYDGRCIFFDTEHLKYYTQIHVRSTRGRNAKGRKITAIEPLPGQDKILVTSNDSRIRLYDLRDLSLACKYKGGLNLSSQIKASFNHNHRYIICGSEDQSIYIWRTNYDFAKFTSVRKDRNGFWESFKGHDAVVTVAVFSPNPIQSFQDLSSSTGSTSRKQSSAGLLRERSDSKGDGLDEPKSEKRGSLKKYAEQPEVIVSGDFNGVIKAFIRKPPKDE